MKRVILVLVVMIVWGCIAGSNAIAGCYPDNYNQPCEGNFDNDCDVDGTDASAFKFDFGRSGLSTPCPSNGPAPVPKTGQRTSYATGDDGDLENGVPLPNPRFTDNEDGTVTDNLTGLIWLEDANCFGQRTWNNALSDCNGLNTGECGLTDGSSAGEWRLPNRFELESLLDMENAFLALPSGHPFTNVEFYYPYWSSTTYANQNIRAWYADMSYGFVNVDFKYHSFYVWPVRGGH